MLVAVERDEAFHVSAISKPLAPRPWPCCIRATTYGIRRRRQDNAQLDAQVLMLDEPASSSCEWLSKLLRQVYDTTQHKEQPCAEPFAATSNKDDDSELPGHIGTYREKSRRHGFSTDVTLWQSIVIGGHSIVVPTVYMHLAHTACGEEPFEDGIGALLVLFATFLGGRRTYMAAQYAIAIEDV